VSGPEARALPTVAVVVLTQGARPAELDRGIRSVLAQQGVVLDVVCVLNGSPVHGSPVHGSPVHGGAVTGGADTGWPPVGFPDAVGSLALPANLGIPAGRNRGVPCVAGEYLFFLDDDASIPDPRFLADAIALMRSDPSIGLLQPRVTDPAGLAAPTRWIPRIRKGLSTQSGPVFSVWEGAVLLPRAVFDATGGWAEPFFYAHEGIELAWRVWDQGLRAWYAGGLEANHPVTQPTRHADYYRLNARNRVWLARRNLPVAFLPLYTGSWLAIQLVRFRSDRPALRAWLAGFREGWRADPGGRRPLRVRTVWRMTRAGRPPIV
jgi:GT2 family glycosyltransferase